MELPLRFSLAFVCFLSMIDGTSMSHKHYSGRRLRQAVLGNGFGSSELLKFRNCVGHRRRRRQAEAKGDTKQRDIRTKALREGLLPPPAFGSLPLPCQIWQWLRNFKF